MKIPPKASKWAKEMAKTNTGKQVLENLEREENVPKDLANKFFNRLSKSYDPSTDPSQQMIGVLGAMVESALAGPEAGLGLVLLTRFAPLARLAQLQVFRSAGISEQILARHPEVVDMLTELPLGNPHNPRSIVWAALHAPISRDEGTGASVSDIVNRLGISDTMDQPMYQATYNTSDIEGTCYVPTVLDAGANHRFRPPKKGATQGMTKPCRANGNGYPEYVHRKCTVQAPGIRLHIMV